MLTCLSWDPFPLGIIMRLLAVFSIRAPVVSSLWKAPPSWSEISRICWPQGPAARAIFLAGLLKKQRLFGGEARRENV